MRSLLLPLQPLQPHVRVWDSVSLSTLQVIGLGTFERGVGSLAFSKAVGTTSTNPNTSNDIIQDVLVIMGNMGTIV